MDTCSSLVLLKISIILLISSFPIAHSNHYVDDAYINLSECQRKSCSFQVGVHCVLQQMHYPCLPGKTKDTFIEKEWPGKARNLTGTKVKSQNKWIAEFSWKPPYDSSIRSLKGFQLHVNIQTEYSSGTPYCFYANITNRNWTEWHNAYDTVFNFNCIKSSKPLNIHVQVVSIPKPSVNWQAVEAELFLPRVEKEYPLWDVNITWKLLQHARKRATVMIEFSPLYPGATYHYICLAENENICHYSSNIKVPGSSVTFENLPFNKTYIIYIRPKKNKRIFMLTHLYKKTIHIPEGSLLRDDATIPYDTNDSKLKGQPDTAGSTTSSVAELPHPDDFYLKLGALITVPLVLLAAILGTVFFFFHRGHAFKFCNVPEQPVRGHQCTSNSEILNNVAVAGQTDINLKMRVTVIYFPESSYFNSCVKSFTSFINKLQNVEAHLVELNSRKFQIEQWGGDNALIVLSDVSYQQNKAIIPTVLNNGMVQVSAVVSFLPIMNIDLKEFQDRYFIIAENLHVHRELRCQYREDDIQNLILTILHQHNSEETSLITINYETPESQKLLASICELCRSILASSKVPTIPYPNHADIVPSVISQNGCHCQQLQLKEEIFVGNHSCMSINPRAFVQNGCPQSMLQSNGVTISNGTVHYDRDKYQSDEKLPQEQKVKYSEDHYTDEHHDSGFSSIPSEQVPFLRNGGSEFLPPESDFGSLEMLEQRMQELNQRSNNHWEQI